VRASATAVRVSERAPSRPSGRLFDCGPGIVDRIGSLRSGSRHGYGLVREAPRLGAEAAPPDGFALQSATDGQSRWIEAGRQARQRERGQHEAEVS
jgi:hypothetical protein